MWAKKLISGHFCISGCVIYKLIEKTIYPFRTKIKTKIVAFQNSFIFLVSGFGTKGFPGCANAEKPSLIHVWQRKIGESRNSNPWVAARAKERKKEKGEGKGRKNKPFSFLSPLPLPRSLTRPISSSGVSTWHFREQIKFAYPKKMPALQARTNQDLKVWSVQWFLQTGRNKNLQKMGEIGKLFRDDCGHDFPELSWYGKILAGN